MYGAFWLRNVYCGKKNQRNWHSQSTRCVRDQYCNDVKQGFCCTGTHFHPYCFTCSLVFNEPVAAGFCLQNQYKLVGLCAGWLFSHIYCTLNGQLPCYQGCIYQPGKEPEDGIIV